jgi:SAM-dependent methyltransferase
MRELARLDLQGAIYHDATRRALVEAGVVTGMRVLDVGSGSGDVSCLLADLVGRAGSVVGVDRESASVAVARERAAARGIENVGFRVGAIDPGAHRGRFDAVVGRFVLMHQPDQAATLARAVAAAAPGGVVVFVESNMATLLTETHSLPRSPLYDRIVRWTCAVVDAAGADLHAGLRLRRTFLDAGLPEPRVRMETPVEGGESPLYRYLAESMTSMWPLATRFGIQGFTASEIADLADRLRSELLESGGVLMAWPVVTAACRTARG